MNSLGNERNATRRLVKDATAQRPKGQAFLTFCLCFQRETVCSGLTEAEGQAVTGVLVCFWVRLAFMVTGSKTPTRV